MEQHNKKKILFLITKSNLGGAQRYVLDLATHLDSTKYETVVALGGNGELVDELREQNVRVITIQSLERDISITKEFGVARELISLIRSERPHVLHINSSKAGGLGSFIGRLLLVPRIIFTAHAWAFNEARPVWQKIIIRFLHALTILFAHTTITVSEAMRLQFTSPFLRNRMVTIHNGISPITFVEKDEARKVLIEKDTRLSPFKNDFWSVTIGELHTVKRHDVTIRALHEIVRIHPTVRHIIMGEGEERTRLEALVRELGLENNVFLLGHVQNASSYLKACDLFVLSSHSEALGYVLVEASQAGLPIIASRVGGIPEVVAHEKTGLLYPSGNETALAQTYIMLLENTSLRDTLGKNAKEKSKDFSLDTMVRETLRLY